MEDTVSKATSIAVNAIKKDKFLSVAIIVSMIATFLILGSFITTFVFTQTAVKSLENEVMVSVYFKDDFSTQSILNLKEKLSKDVRISDVRYVSKEDAFKIFTLLNKGDKLLLESVTASILPASLELKAVNISDIETIATEMRKESGVEDVRFFKDAVNRFKMWSSIVNMVGLTVVGVFLFISFSIIVIALRLTISAKGVEISILRLVGASEDYVKKPLVAQAVMYSLFHLLLPLSCYLSL
jgi:cell division transport system permease protein